jgi:hypothetical protein
MVFLKRDGRSYWSTPNKHGVKVELVINKEFWNCLQKLRKYASKKTEELKSPVLRMMQIEEKLKKRLKVG